MLSGGSYLESYDMIDLHTHQSWPGYSGMIRIRSFQFSEIAELKTFTLPFSVGIHPWEAGDGGLDLALLERWIQQPNCLAVGESGLDKLRGPVLEVQIRWLMAQAQLAMSHSKPMIIHCVRYWNELITIRRKFPEVPAWIIHGFRGKAELAAQLVRHGFYLAFGTALMEESAALAEVFAQVPVNRLFLETDEGDATIEEVYTIAASIRQITPEQLQTAIINNFNTVFGNDVLPRLASTH